MGQQAHAFECKHSDVAAARHAMGVDAQMMWGTQSQMENVVTYLRYYAKIDLELRSARKTTPKERVSMSTRKLIDEATKTKGTSEVQSDDDWIPTTTTTQPQHKHTQPMRL